MIVDAIVTIFPSEFHDAPATLTWNFQKYNQTIILKILANLVQLAKKQQKLQKNVKFGPGGSTNNYIYKKQSISIKIDEK